MAATLLLDRDAWDLALNASGNIAVATEPYAQVQDVASSCRCYRGEPWYHVSRGVPYGQILGHFQPVQVVRESLVQAALLVPGVTAATVVLSGLADRTVRGQVQITVGGAVQTVSL